MTGEDVALVFHTAERLSKRAREGVETLAAQVALALESANLAADLHQRQSAERFRSLVQNSSDVIALLSPDLTIRYHTPSVERVLGYGEDELVGPEAHGAPGRPGRREARRLLRGRLRDARRADAARPALAPQGRHRRPARERLQQPARRRRTSAESFSPRETSPSAARSRISSRTRRSTTRSPGSRTARSSPSGSRTRSSAARAAGTSSPCSSSTSTTSRP